MTSSCVARRPRRVRPRRVRPCWVRRCWVRPCSVRTCVLLTGLLGLAVTTATGWAATAHTANDVQALVERAAAHIKSVGQKQAFADITRPDGGFTDGDLYVFCNSADGTVLANGGNPKLIGKSLAAVTDSEGRKPVFDGIRLALTQGQAWLEYLWPNPPAGRVQHKMTFVLRIDDRTVCGSGYYKLDPP
jgi:cytochrome c